jgi:REP element-mobilizing transposase RayT
MSAPENVETWYDRLEDDSKCPTHDRLEADPTDDRLEAYPTRAGPIGSNSVSFDGVFRRRQLPHWDVEGRPVFVTACLEGSISAKGLSQVRRYRRELDGRNCPANLSQSQWEGKKQKLIFKFVDSLLDHESPVTHLLDVRQAKIVHDAFLHFAGERYALFAFVVMPSHHHWLFLPSEEWAREQVRRLRETGERLRTPREIISHSIQSYTATMCNRVRGGSGSYWQMETFDHWARDDAETLRIIEYIENNPVKAGLVERPHEWPWSSAHVRAASGLSPGDAILKSHVG